MTAGSTPGAQAWAWVSFDGSVDAQPGADENAGHRRDPVTSAAYLRASALRRHFDFDHRRMPDNLYWMTRREYTWEVAVPSPDNSAHRSIYVYEMMRRFGIDPAEGVVPRLSMAYMTAVRRCQACRAKDECRRWLDSMFPPVSIIPSFCSNEDILFELRVNHPGRAKAAVDYCACIADLELFVNEINETLLDKAAGDQLVAELKSRKARLCDQIEKLRCKPSRGASESAPPVRSAPPRV